VRVACVTGASGLIGRRVVEQLRAEDVKVRALSRNAHRDGPGIRWFQADLAGEVDLEPFLDGADDVYNCAGELLDPARMWRVNVNATARLVAAVARTGIDYFCHISSAGVVGRTECSIVDENTPCAPRNVYEASKLAAERLIFEGAQRCRTVVLRPTHVVDAVKPGAVLHPSQGGWRDRVAVFLKGGESSHVVHAADVADAAVRLREGPQGVRELYFVSYDDIDSLPLAELRRRAAGVFSETPALQERRPRHLPLVVPHLLRILAGRVANRGDVLYASARLRESGYRFPIGPDGIVRRVLEEAEHQRRAS
jgi:nucleoside-diphosphate-sugar epimerase